jgi:hypothetical protein
VVSCLTHESERGRLRKARAFASEARYRDFTVLLESNKCNID